MVFVYLGIAVVVIFLFLVIYYHRKTIFKKRPPKVKEKQVDDPDTYVDPKRVEINDFSDPIVKEYDDVDQVLTPEENLPKVSKIEDLDDLDYQYDMFERATDYFEKTEQEDDDCAPEGPDGSFREMMQQRISIGRHSLVNEKPTIHGDDDDDYDEMITDYDFGGENASFAKRFAELPPDMKALMMSDILNRKY